MNLAARRITLAVPELVCASVLDHIKAESPSRVSQVDFGDDTPIEVATADAVLYVPALHLQVWRDRIVPYEANTDQTAFPDLHSSAAAGEVLSHALLTNVGYYDGPVCVLSNIYSHNFYHFLEELYKVVILERAGFTGSYVFSGFPSWLSQDLPRFSLEFLDLLGIPRARVVHLTRPTVLHSVWFTTPISHTDVTTYRNVFLALRASLIAAAAGPSLGRRLWLERRTSRLLVNVEQVHQLLNRYGFTILDMADLPVGRQIAAAADARVLAGVHGSAHIHAMFMQEHSTVIECFSPNYVNFNDLDICSVLHHRFLQSVPMNTSLFLYPHGFEVEVNCQHLQVILDSLED